MVFYKVSSEIIISLHSLITWTRSVLLSVILYLLNLHDGTSSPKSKSKLKSDIYIFLLKLHSMNVNQCGSCRALQDKSKTCKIFAGRKV